MLDDRKVEVKAGEHVLVVGEPGVGKTLLFRALAGLWPWGAGCIARPSGEPVFFMPRRPYLPPGTLRDRAEKLRRTAATRLTADAHRYADELVAATMAAGRPDPAQIARELGK